MSFEIYEHGQIKRDLVSYEGQESGRGQLLRREMRMGKFTVQDKNDEFRTLDVVFSGWKEQKVHAGEQQEMRQSHILHRNLIFIIK